MQAMSIKNILAVVVMSYYSLQGMESQYGQHNGIETVPSTVKITTEATKEKQPNHKPIVSLRQQELEKAKKKMHERDIQEERKIEDLDKHLEHQVERSDTPLGIMK